MTLNFYNNGNDTVIAESPEDAAKVWEETVGGTWEEHLRDEDSDAEWELENYSPITVHFEDEEDAREMAPEGAEIWQRDQGYWCVKATRQEWIDKSGRCFFSSVDW